MTMPRRVLGELRRDHGPGGFAAVRQVQVPVHLGGEPGDEHPDRAAVQLVPGRDPVGSLAHRSHQATLRHLRRRAQGRYPGHDQLPSRRAEVLQAVRRLRFVAGQAVRVVSDAEIDDGVRGEAGAKGSPPALAEEFGGLLRRQAGLEVADAVDAQYAHHDPGVDRVNRSP